MILDKLLMILYIALKAIVLRLTWAFVPTLLHITSNISRALL